MTTRFTSRRSAGLPRLGRGLATLAMATFAAGFLTSCDIHDPAGPGTITTIDVTPDVTLAIQETQQFVAVATDAEGREVEFSPVWSVVEGGGTIDDTGLFTAGTVPGVYTSTIMAAAGGLSGTATVTVVVGPLATITVTPNPDTLAANTTSQFTATGADAGGNPVAITATWAVVNGGGDIDTDGLFTAGGSAGTFTNTVRASSGSVDGYATVVVLAGPLATITVTPNPDTLGAGAIGQFTAAGADADGNPVAITPTWAEVNGGGSIDSDGLFTAGSATGTFTNTVRARSGGIDGFATVVVVPGALATITVMPNPDTLETHATSQFTATGADAAGNPVAIIATWATVNGGGSIDGDGLFTAADSTGTFTNTVRATSGGVEGFATVTVEPGPLATITVTPNPDTLDTNTTSQFTAVGEDADGNPVAITPSWAVVNGGGFINSNGLFTAGSSSGTFTNTVRASSGGVNGFATVVVEAGVAPSPPFLDLGTAAPNGIIAGTEVTCINNGFIFADISIHPGLALTGFGPAECTNTGATNLGDAVAQQAQIDLATAYNTLVGLACDQTIVANLGGTTLLPGVYCSASSIGVTGTVTLDGNGDPDAVFVFQAGSALTTAGSVVLINGAQARNVYWQVGSSATLGTASQWQGNILALTSITLNDSATMLGRALARNGAVTLGTNNTITLP